MIGIAHEGKSSIARSQCSKRGRERERVREREREREGEREREREKEREKDPAGFKGTNQC